MPTTMLTPEGAAPALAPFGHCPFCDETVRLFRGANEPAWRCRGCGLRVKAARAAPARDPFRRGTARSAVRR